MTETAHHTFTVPRHLPAPLPRAWRAFADADTKRRWFACHADWRTVEYALDCRPGGHERSLVVTPAGGRHLMEATYLDAVPEARIVYAHAMSVNDARLSASLVTLTFEAEGAATRLIWTEQIVLLDGRQDLDERIHGTRLGLDALGAWLAA
ncbi:SRPBCC family protein [Wenxinia marina]|uniref:Activator of Hsp90 ATPase homologue 1/2-like C-terminal domain-containing protein n=1 Tax=Wenxinia marina DSM 24838 TaxID=1123501 RepID=A0A0D0Q1C3_9RHOB|nr:SRPBCC family protein [Wenxinia marina]KIQ68384.1 hypothetical protein Wenmar_03031 [Wenxinia marina DSM 24838]GGL72631.1 hypothetical protein GCM10011392_29050 [Wenxinia marina]